jgi:uncharacterized protein (DUF983 family)
MTCPLCLKTAMPFSRFLFVINQRSVSCGNCGEQLRLSPRWSRIWWTSLIVGCLVALASIVLRRIIGWGLWTNVAALIVIAAVVNWYFWRSAIYEAKPEISRPAADLELP